MEFQLFAICVSFLILAGTLSLPIYHEKRFLVDCDQQINCSEYDEMDPELCGTDGKTYAGQCQLDKTNQRRFCKVGDFNQIGVRHLGNCTDDE